MQGPVGPLSRGVGDEAKVPDGLRYHVLDIWVEELVPVLEDGEKEEEINMGELLMDVVRTLAREGRGKALRKRAKEAVGEWEKWKNEVTANMKNDDRELNPVQSQPSVSSDDEWEGFED